MIPYGTVVALIEVALIEGTESKAQHNWPCDSGALSSKVWEQILWFYLCSQRVQ